jgi:hypothetical protein
MGGTPMHQQVRLSIRKSLADGSRARLDDESLVGILSLLRGANLQSAGRVNTDAPDGGEFVFSVQHDPGDDSANPNARNLLKSKDYGAEAYDVREFMLEHKKGALLKCIRDLEKELNEPVIEVYVGAADADGSVPVQLVTRSMLASPIP